MCAAHVHGIPGAPAAGHWHSKTLAPTGMPNGHPAHVWVGMLGPLAWGASRAAQLCHKEVRLCVYRPSPACPAGAAPPKTRTETVFLFYNSKICYLSQISVLVQMNPFIYHVSEQFYCSTDQKKRRPWLLNKGGLPFRTHTTALRAHQTPPAPQTKNEFQLTVQARAVTYN